MKPPFTPTQEMITAAELCFIAKAHTQTVRPIVEAHQKKVLSENFYKCGNELAIKVLDRGGEVPEFCKDHSDLVYISDRDFADYHAKVYALNTQKKLKVESYDHCPLLVAEELERKADRHLCDVMEPITKLSADQVLSSANCLENYKQLVDLTLRLLAPFARKQPELLRAYSKRAQA